MQLWEMGRGPAGCDHGRRVGGGGLAQSIAKRGAQPARAASVTPGRRRRCGVGGAGGWTAAAGASQAEATAAGSRSRARRDEAVEGRLLSPRCSAAAMRGWWDTGLDRAVQL